MPEAHVALAQEGGKWVVSLPAGTDAKQLTQKISQQLQQASSQKAQWPADPNDGARAISHAVLIAFSSDAGASGRSDATGAGTSGIGASDRSSSGTSGTGSSGLGTGTSGSSSGSSGTGTSGSSSSGTGTSGSTGAGGTGTGTDAGAGAGQQQK